MHWADIDRVNNCLLKLSILSNCVLEMVFEASRTEGIAISVAPEGLKDDGGYCTVRICSSVMKILKLPLYYIP